MSNLSLRSDLHPADEAGSQTVLDATIGLVRRRWRLALGVFVLAMVVAVAVIVSLPKQYQSTARFLVKNARQRLVVGPTEQAIIAYREEVPEETMNTELELLRSRDVLAQVVNALKLHEAYLPQVGSPAQALEFAINDLANGLAAETLRKTNLIQVTYSSQDPQHASHVLQNLADVYLARHLAIHSSAGAYDLFRQQAEEVDLELREAERELAALAESANLVKPELQVEEALGSYTDAEIKYAALMADIREMTARVRTAEQKKLEIPQRHRTAVRNLPNQYSTERLNTLIVELTNRRTQLLTKFNPDDRLVKEVEQQIADTRQALAETEALSVDEVSSDVNPAWQLLDVESLNAQMALSGLVNKAAEMRQQMERFKRQAQLISEARPRYEALARRVEQLQATYELYVKKQEEARIAQTLDNEHIANVVLAQAPFAATVPSSPDMRIALIIAISVASVLSACAVIAAEQLRAAALALRRRRDEMTVGDDRSAAAALP